MGAKARFFLGSAVVFLIGSAFHFLFDLLSRSPIAAVFFAVNESVWEHVKLLNSAALAWIAVDWFLAGEQCRRRYFLARAVALPPALMSIPLLYYFFIGAFSLESLALDMGIFAFSTLLYQWLALRLEKRSLALSRNQRLGIGVMAALFLMFAIFSFVPPHIPLFLDTSTGTYGR